MNQDIPGISSNLDKNVNHEQFDQVVEAILAGKYSWACVLMLRFAGYNPLHYIPYRTYNRLLKENTTSTKKSHKDTNLHENTKASKPSTAKVSQSKLANSCLSKIKDLTYLEVVGKQNTEIRGGSLEDWLSVQITETQGCKSDLPTPRETDNCLKFYEFN